MLTCWSMAWLSLCAALALHVVDEAANAAEIRAVIPIFPVFTFSGWMDALGAAISLLVALTPFAGAPAMRRPLISSRRS